MLSSLQSGVIPEELTVNRLAYLYHIVTEALDAGKEVRTVFCDIIKLLIVYGMKDLLTNLKLPVFQETSSDGFIAISQDVSV